MIRKEQISLDKFEYAFTRAGWTQRTSKDGNYTVWIDPMDASVWTMQPKDTNSPEYNFYQDQNILILLYALKIPESNETITELTSQLKSYNYKLINRIAMSSSFSNNSVPYELATALPERNVDAFRYFYQVKSQKHKAIPIEKFEMNHTEVGSFIIPVSISVDEDEALQLATVATDTNVMLHNYLKAVDRLKEIPQNSPEDFAERVLAEDLNSKIVKDFFSHNNSIAKYKEKYKEQIKEITIGSKGSFVLDFGLRKEEKEFRQVDIGGIEVINDEYIEALERLEVTSDSSKIEMYGVQVNVLVDSINIGGKVLFEVLELPGVKLDKPFKAISSQLTKAQLDICADYFKERKPASILADVTKAKGRMGMLIIESVNPGKMSTTGPQQLEFR